jgi:hypothetical protein
MQMIEKGKDYQDFYHHTHVQCLQFWLKGPFHKVDGMGLKLFNLIFILHGYTYWKYNV